MTLCSKAAASPPAVHHRWECSRRLVLMSPALLLSTARPSGALPLAPLGPVKRVGGEKRVNLPVADVKVNSIGHVQHQPNQGTL